MKNKDIASIALMTVTGGMLSLEKEQPTPISKGFFRAGVILIATVIGVISVIYISNV